jgi:DNA mismatch repair protein MutS
MADSIASAPTPFMAQYLAAKAQHPDAMLFFRMGDFYELFFQDAEQAAAALGITLTARGQHGGDPIPMAGVPWHQADGYLEKLIRAGFSVAVCEQVEDPAEAKKRGGKSIVRREVVRVVTPGTLTEDSLLEARSANRLIAIAARGEEAAIASAEISTGVFRVRTGAPAAMAESIASLQAAEALISEEDAQRPLWASSLNDARVRVTLRPAVKADPRFGARRLMELFQVATLDSFGGFSDLELSAIALLIDYVELTQAGAAPRLSPPVQDGASDTMVIDAVTRASLELDRAVDGGRKGSLLGAIDRTLTAAGGRTLADRLSAPLLDPLAIDRRLASVAWFVEERPWREAVRQALQGSADVARALTRLALGRGGPRDLAALRLGLLAGEKAALAIGGDAPDELKTASEAARIGGHGEIATLLNDLGAALCEALPLLTRDGGFIAEGYDAALDEHRALSRDAKQVVAGLQQAYADQTGLALKIKHNGVLGYHLEATTKQAESLMRPPLSALFVHRQTTANTVRFTTAELAELDARIARAADAALARELSLFQGFAARAAAQDSAIRAAAQGAAILDVSSALADWAEDAQACRPEIDVSGGLIAEGARHVVVEQALRRQGRGFTPNDIRLDAEGQAGPRLLFVTGPNMGGKSTFLRQTALLAILAQAGSFVPARRLRLGVCDRVFSRVGASDDLARGRSTFMTEMVETAAILNQAGPRALVILDEIGRGTATYDGLAIAWATAEHLHDVNRCRAVFATHFHELTGLSARKPAAANAHVRAKEHRGELIFLHEVGSGAADRSYGVQVAKLAGLPRAAVERARAVLARLEAQKGQSPLAIDDMPLFATATTQAGPTHPVLDLLAQSDPDALTPREAAALIYRLKALAAQDPDGG